ncbi:MAG: type II toxin-antitoxin system RelE/ParE family toxin [Oscillospiraceae bacterium]|jgi:hypothetical protein|nr:type II toxin-antitoxin system RelE/ParE family toxin [Oscillospiraceae bacterium]
MSYTVRIAANVRQRVDAHIAFLARVSQSAALRLMDVLFADVADLAHSPHRFPIYESNKTQEELHWRLSAKRYRIVFSISDESVYIRDVQDCRQGDESRFV